MLLQDGGVGRPVESIGHDLLRLVAVEVLEVGLGCCPRLVTVHVLVDDRHVRLGPDADRGIDNLQRPLGLLHLEARLVLPGEMDIADVALREGRAGAARAGVEHRHLLVELGDVVDGLVPRSAPQHHGAPGAEEGEIAVARGLGIRRDDRNPRFDEVRPILHAFGVPFADHEDDGRHIGERLVRQPVDPTLLDEAASGDGIGVDHRGQADDVGLETVDDRPGLGARAAVRLLHLHGLPGLRFPGRGEPAIDVLVELAGRVVGDIEQPHLGVGGRGAGERQQPQRQQREFRRLHRRFSWRCAARNSPAPDRGAASRWGGW